MHSHGYFPRGNKKRIGLQFYAISNKIYVQCAVLSDSVIRSFLYGGGRSGGGNLLYFKPKGGVNSNGRLFEKWALRPTN